MRNSSKNFRDVGETKKIIWKAYIDKLMVCEKLKEDGLMRHLIKLMNLFSATIKDEDSMFSMELET